MAMIIEYFDDDAFYDGVSFCDGYFHDHDHNAGDDD